MLQVESVSPAPNVYNTSGLTSKGKWFVKNFERTFDFVVFSIYFTNWISEYNEIGETYVFFGKLFSYNNFLGAFCYIEDFTFFKYM
jgi:hypothetical protein